MGLYNARNLNTNTQLLSYEFYCTANEINYFLISHDINQWRPQWKFPLLVISVFTKCV